MIFNRENELYKYLKNIDIKYRLSALIISILSIIMIGGFTANIEDFFKIVKWNKSPLIVQYIGIFICLTLTTKIYTYTFNKIGKLKFINYFKKSMIFLTFFLGGFLLYRNIYIEYDTINFVYSKIEYMVFMSSTLFIFWCDKIEKNNK